MTQEKSVDSPTKGNIYFCYISNILHFLQLPKLPTTYICECPLEFKKKKKQLHHQKIEEDVERMKITQPIKCAGLQTGTRGRSIGFLFLYSLTPPGSSFLFCLSNYLAVSSCRS